MARKTFHHGDLRRSILDAALRLIEEKGVRGFTLSDAAREAGVSKSAPYRHFENKEAIIVAVAIDCFERFEAQLAAAAARPTPRHALHALLHAYLDTALKTPAEFRAMFASGLDKGEYRELAIRAERCFGHLKSAVVLCQTYNAPTPPQAPRAAEAVTFQLWIAVHGLAVLAIDGSLRKLGGEKRIFDLLDHLLERHLAP